MLVGREAQRRRIDDLLDQARSGQGGAIVLTGEAGIGKTKLLKYAAARAESAGTRVLRTCGIESEAELPFAALHQLIRPFGGLVEGLPERQAAALNVALAILPGNGVDRFAVQVAALTLLGVVSSTESLVCIVDDAHWLDEESAGALVFAARRLQHEAVAVLFAARAPEATGLLAAGIDVVGVTELSRDEARTLLATRRPALPPPAAEAIVRSSRGNPLALVEFAAAHDGDVPVDEPLAVREEVLRSFSRRAERLSHAARRALLLVAAGEAAEPEAIWAALELERIPAEAVAEAQTEGLLLPGRRLRFCHPLARSAIYHGASADELGSAHRTLARATREPLARVWHLAAAATGPDAGVADALEQAATRARRRGGAAVEARALERSARLTPATELRAHRLFRAALAAEASGRPERAERLLLEAGDLTQDAEIRCEAASRRSYLLFDRGDFDRAIELAMRAVDDATPAAGARLLTASGVVHALVHRLAIPDALAVAERAERLAGESARKDLDLCHMLAWTWELSGQTSQALGLARECLPRVDPASVLAIDFAIHFIYLEDYRTARDALERIVLSERRTGSFGNLAYALDNLANLDLRTGRTVAAYSHSLEAVQLMESLGVDVGIGATRARLALIEASLGMSDDARAHGTGALEVAAARGDRWNEVRARAGLGLEALSRGDFWAAVMFLEPAARMLEQGGVHHPNMFRVHGDLVEALTRTGRRAEAERSLALFDRDARLSGSPWARGVAARGRAGLVDAADGDAAFDAAVRECDGAGEFESARTLLAYGERLRRLGRRRAARERFHLALESFENLNAMPWADHARSELRATGERLRPRGRRAHEQLTPQELQVALAAADGLRNKEIAARLFLSPKTVEFHLTRAYRKLGIRSRAELVRVLSKPGDLPESLSA